MNLRKSSVFFSLGITQGRGREISQLLGTSKCLTSNCYLGFPLLGRRKVVQHEFLVQRVTEKLSSWKAATLSHVGRGLIIKVVIQAMPTHLMSCLFLPFEVVDDLCSLSTKTKFFWSLDIQE